MSLLNWIFDIYQHSKINKLQNELELRRDAQGPVDADRLERAIGELALAVKTVQRIAVEKGLCTPQEFQDRMRAIDAEDGRIDGQSPVR